MKPYVLPVLGLAVGLMAASAQSPALPPINPTAAKADAVLGQLDGPGFAVGLGANLLAAACDRGTIHCWTPDVALGVRAGDATGFVLRGHEGPVIALDGRNNQLASVGVDKKIILWDMPAGKAVHTLTSSVPVRSLALSPDGKLLVAGGEDAVVQTWDVASGKPGAKWTGHADWVLAVAFSEDGKTLASGGHDGVVLLWDVAGGKKLLDIPARAPAPPNQPPTETSSVLSLAFAPDGKSLAVGCASGQVHLFSLPDGKYLRGLPGHTSAVTALTFHPTGTVLVSASRDRSVRLWNPANGQALKVLEGHTAWVEDVTFLAEGTRLASVGADRTVRLWDLTGK